MNNPNISFELIWEASEALYKNDPSDIQSIANELIAKIALYKALDLNNEIEAETKPKLKERMMGSILSTLTHLSLKDNVNTYIALKDAIATTKMDKMAAQLKK